MLRKVSIIFLFILTMLAGALISFLSVQVTSAEQPYQIAQSRQYLNSRIKGLEGRIKLLETEMKKLKDEPEKLSEDFALYKQETNNKLDKIRRLLEDHMRSVGSTEFRIKPRER